MNAQLIPVLPDGCILRTEFEGGIFISGRGFFRTISIDELKVLREVNGCETAYSIAKGLSSCDAELANHLIRIFKLAEDGIICLREVRSVSGERARGSVATPFSSEAFSTPVMVSLAVTGECNRRCGHCYREGVSCGSSLNEEGFFSIVEMLAQLDIAVLNITGGEPFLYEPMVALATYAASMINCVTISTNGTLLERGKLRALKTGGVDRIQIGLNALFDSDAAHCDESSSRRVFDAMRVASEEGLEVAAGVVLTKNTIGNLESIFTRSSEAEAVSIKLGPLMNVHPGCEAVQVAPVKVLEAALLATKLADRTGIPVQFVDGLGGSSEVPRNTDERKHYCYLGTGILHIEPDGSLYPCSALLPDEFRLGEVSERTTIEELRNTWRESQILIAMRRATLDRLEGCRACEVRAVCGGGCRTAAYWNTGSIMGDNPFCEIAKGRWEK